VFSAPRDKALRQPGTDPRQSCDFAHVGTIDIDAVTGKKRTGELRGPSRGFAQAAWLNDGR